MAFLGGCAQRSNVITVSTAPGAVEVPGVRDGGAAMIPKASAFRMSGDYADKVAVTFDGSGKLVYYPAPTDISQASRPVSIGDGWWLNRQGISGSSVFTKWTFDEYMRLPSAPSTDEIKAAVIPGAVVTEFRRLPVSASEAAKLPPSSLLQLLR